MSTSLMMGLSMVSATLGTGVGDLSSLFANGENGFLFDAAADLSRLFTTYTGPTIVAANNDPAGAWLDNHGWAGKTRDQLLASQPEVLPTPSPPGSGSSLPANWVLSGSGLTLTIVGSGTDGNGIPYVDIRFSGTPSATFALVGPSSAGVIAALKDQTERYSQYVALIAGTLTNISSIAHGNQYTTSGGSFLGSLSTGDIKASLDATLRAQVGYFTPSFVGTAFSQPRLILGLTAGNAIDVTLRIGTQSFKRVPGNHALQPTGTRRPLWKSNSGKPYLALDGGDDYLLPPAFAARTLAFAGRMTGADGVFQVPLGLNGAGNSRVRINRDTAGTISASWGTSTAFAAVSVGALGTPFVGVLTGDTTSAELYVNGLLAGSQASAGLGPDGAAGAALGCFNNNGTPGSYCACDAFAALALDRRVTTAEIARITTRFRSNYQ